MSNSDSRPSLRLAPYGRLAVPPKCLLFASATVRHHSTGPGAFETGSPAPDSLPLRGERRASQVPGKPLCGHALLFDPGGPSLPSRTAGSCCLPSIEGCRRPQRSTFRGSITRPIHSLCTLRSGGYPTPRNTRYRLVASLGRVGLAPTGFQFILSTSSVSRMTRLCLAHSILLTAGGSVLMAIDNERSGVVDQHLAGGAAEVSERAFQTL